MGKQQDFSSQVVMARVGVSNQWVKLREGKSFHYGYKEHAIVEVKQGYIEDLRVTPANVHDGTMLQPMINGRRMYLSSSGQWVESEERC